MYKNVVYFSRNLIIPVIYWTTLVYTLPSDDMILEKYWSDKFIATDQNFF